MLLHLESKNTTSHTFNDICKHTTSAHEHGSPMALTEVEQQESKVTPQGACNDQHDGAEGVNLKYA